VRVVARAAQGDESAHRWLYETYRPALERVCAAFATLDADEVEDVVQESFVRAFRRLSTLRSVEALGPWLLSIARNRCLSLLERKSTAESLKGELGRETPPPDPLPEVIEREAAAEVVRRLIDELPEGPEKDTVRMFYVDGTLSAREIAERVGVGKSAVTMRLERFRAKVKHELLLRLLAQGLET
jgi:RNA polymerase sigma-70 factor (ECF subfamily)